MSNKQTSDDPCKCIEEIAFDAGRKAGLKEASLFVAKIASIYPNNETGDNVMLTEVSIQIGEIK